jgi:hypothetical protein
VNNGKLTPLLIALNTTMVAISPNSKAQQKL